MHLQDWVWFTMKSTQNAPVRHLIKRNYNLTLNIYILKYTILDTIIYYITIFYK